MAGFNAVEHFLHPERAFPARRALAAAFVGVKLGNIQRRIDDANVFGQHDDTAAAGHR